LLNENEVIRLLVAHLTAEGLQVTHASHTRQQGPDLIFEEPKSGSRLLIEAKGETSSKAESGDFGNVYRSGKTKHQVAIGFYQAVRMKYTLSRPGDRIGLAFPDTPAFRLHIEPILPVLRRLGLPVFLVAEKSGTVRDFAKLR
jgi:hypothetical protein